LTAIGPPVALAQAWQIALVAGLAACEAVRKVASGVVDARVRFPNDVTSGGRKLAGVLVETVSAAPPANVIPLIGIGINVRAAPLPPEVAAIATSLEAETGEACLVEDVEAVLLRQMTLRWEEWLYGDFAATLARWKPLADSEARRVFIIEGHPVSCRVCDIEEDGAVLLETPAGGIRRVPAAAVVLGEET
jgi:BirA family biotin operon repressor/biotin-[acetyl-CoA-carboxylase] ligase